jgi:hypothetical protein
MHLGERGSGGNFSRERMEKTMTSVTFGEVMLRPAAPSFERFLQTPRFAATFGGGEANVRPELSQESLVMGKICFDGDA